MPLLTSNIQSQYHTLVEKYGELSQDKDPRGQGVGNAMLAFISMVNETFKETYIFGFISHWDLCLADVDGGESEIIVSALYNINEKTVEYLISPSTFRFRYLWWWPLMGNKAKSLSEAKKYLILEMRKNISWSSYSKELKQLLIDNDNN